MVISNSKFVSLVFCKFIMQILTNLIPSALLLHLISMPIIINTYFRSEWTLWSTA